MSAAEESVKAIIVSEMIGCQIVTRVDDDGAVPAVDAPLLWFGSKTKFMVEIRVLEVTE